MSRKRDLQEVDAVARQFGMDADSRRAFGDYLEECKQSGDCGTKNDRGDFTWNELIRNDQEFQGFKQ